MSAQLLGFVLLAAGLAVLLSSALPLLIAGGLCLLAPEVGAYVRRLESARREKR